MALENVLEQIREEGKQQAQDIVDEGRETANDILAQARTDAEELMKQKKHEIEQEVEERRKVRRSRLKMQYQRKQLKLEKEVLNECWERLEAHVSDIDEGRNRDLLNKLLHVAHATPVFSIQSVVAGERIREQYTRERPFYIYSNERDKDVVLDLSDLEFGGIIDCVGGIIAEAETGNWRVNLTYDVILEEVFEKSLITVYQILLGEGTHG
jgi:V/A-type H+-transporting ATPase subunit E